MKALEYLKSIPIEWLPKSRTKGISPPSNSDLFRWLNSGSVVINGVKPKSNDDIELPICQLIFFPKGNRVTMV